MIGNGVERAGMTNWATENRGEKRSDATWVGGRYQEGRNDQLGNQELKSGRGVELLQRVPD